MKTRSILRRGRLPFLSAAALLLLSAHASAQNVSNWSGATSGNWATATNWDAAPVSGADTELVFLGGANAATVNDFPGTFQLTALTLDSAATTNFSVGGNGLSFVTGTNPASISAGTTAGRLQFTVPVNFAAATTLTTNANNAVGGEIFFDAPITAAAGTTVSLSTTPPGTIVMLGAANIGFAGTWAQSANTLTQLGAHNALWRQMIITMSGTTAVTTGRTSAAGYSLPDAGFNQQVGNVSGTGQLLVGTTTSASTVLSGFANTSVTLSGAAGLAGFNGGSHFGKVGTGTLTVSGTNASMNMGVSVRQGTLTLSGAAGSVTNSLTAGAISVYGSGQLRLANATAMGAGLVAGRLSDTADVRVASGGTLRLDGNTAVAQTENLGALKVYGGGSTIVVNTTSAAGANGRINFTALPVPTDLDRGGQVALIAPGLGGAGAGQGQITFTGAPVTGILPWAITQTNYTNAGAGSATNTFAADSLAVLTATGAAPVTVFVDNDLTSGTNDVRLNTAAAPAGAAAANSLTIETGGALNLGGTLTLTSGALFSRANAATISGGQVTSAGRMYLNSSGNLIISSAINAPAGLSKGGSGTLNLDGTATVPAGGVVSVNGGTLSIGVGGIPGNVVFQVGAGATLSSPILTVPGTLRGNGAVTGNVLMGAGSLIGGSNLASTLASGAAPGTLTITGNLTLNGTGRLNHYMSSVFGGSQTQSLITTTGVLDLTGATPGNTFVVRPFSILLSNEGAGAVYDFDSTLPGGYTFTMITAAGGIVGFAPDKFSIDLANFANPLNGGTFVVQQAGNNLNLVFQPIPEPALLGLAAFGLLAVARRRKA